MSTKTTKHLTQPAAATKPVPLLTLALLLGAFLWPVQLSADAGPIALPKRQNTQEGLLPPWLPQAQCGNIASLATGLLFWNTSSRHIQVNNASTGALSWYSLGFSSVVVTLDCAGADVTGTLTSDEAASGVSASVPYTGGDGSPYNGQWVASSGVTGLTATLAAGTFANGEGDLVFAITGTPAASGTANFALDIGGQACTLSLTAGAGTTANCGAYVAPNEWKLFMCHNLAAANTAPPTPSPRAGRLSAATGNGARKGRPPGNG